MNAPQLDLIHMVKTAAPLPMRMPRDSRAVQTLPNPKSWHAASLAYPLRHLGALTIYFFWIALVTGIYLFLFYETSLSGAWLSVERLTHEQWYLGGVMRSLHRYASDAAVITIAVHLIREFVVGRCRGPFWYSWVTGVPLLWIVAVFGISGYWMVWDELAQFIAIGTARLLDWMPIFTDPMMRSFLTNDVVNERFFTLIAFIHLVGLPIVLVIGIWVHLLRIRLPRINPPRALMALSLAVLLLVSLLVPALSHPPADLARVPMALSIDWFYLALFPLLAVTSESLVWALLTGVTLLLAALPWMPPAAGPPIAEVHLDNCSACGYCAEDCPYGAIDMVPRNDARNLLRQAQVDASLCVGCGICAGACPSSSPLRGKQPLVSGIELPALTIAQLKARIDAAAVQHSGGCARTVIFGCDHGVRVDKVQETDVTAISLPCIGMLPTAFVDYTLRSRAADAVVIAGCDDCHFRYGDVWMQERLQGKRNPRLRSRVPRDRLLVCWHAAGAHAALGAEIDAFRARLRVVHKSAETGNHR
jgi:ferredoxin/coenzyme F420-reducing hydrogenase delta subunit